MKKVVFLLIMIISLSSLYASDEREKSLEINVTTFFDTLINQRITSYYIHEKINKFFKSQEDSEIFLATFLELLHNNKIKDNKIISYKIEKVNFEEGKDIAIVKYSVKGKKFWWLKKEISNLEQKWIKIGDNWYILY